MADIIINGTEYKDVPSIEVPSSDGGVAEFKEKITPWEALVEEFKSKGWSEVAVETVTQQTLRDLENEKKFVTALPEMASIPCLSDCRNLVLKEFPTTTTTTLSGYSFEFCDNIFCSDFFPNLKEIGTYAFRDAHNLRIDKLCDSLSYIGAYSFYGCRNVTVSELPELCSTLGSSAFQGCCSIKSMKSYKNLKTYNSRCFYTCRELQLVDCYANLINSEALAYCSNLESLILRNPEIATLNNSNALTSTKIKSGTGYIYVPSALLDSYKTATNWSVYADQFRALENYTVDGTTTGELDESKI